MPWGTDRVLTAATASCVIASQFPQLAPVQIEFLGSGWCNDAYLVNGEWVFRFPRRVAVQAELRREIVILPILAEALDVGVPVIELVGQPSELFPYLFVGHRMIRGMRSGAVDVPPERQLALAEQVGRMLTQVHAIPPERIPTGDEQGVFDHDQTRSPADYLTEVVKVADAFRQAVGASLAERWESWLRGEVNPPPAYAGLPRFTHNDLGDDHLLMDPSTSQIVGVIDWSDAAFGDPCVDFLFLNHWLGAAFIDRVLQHYALPVDPVFHDRLQFNTTATAIIWTANAYQIGDPVDIRRWRDWFANIFAQGHPGWPAVARTPKK